ncbi:hypothetical protein QBC41DRAFT_198086, partial [Cercophora samala]
MSRRRTIDLSANALAFFASHGFRPSSAPPPARSTSQQHEQAPKPAPPPNEAPAPSPPVDEPPALVNAYDPAEYYRGRSLWSQCAKPDLLKFFEDFEEFRAGGPQFTPEEVHEAILKALKSAKQRPKDAQRVIPEDFRKIVDERRALPEHQWTVVDAALYLGKCCFKERAVAGTQISFQPADLKDISFRKAVMLMAFSGIRDMKPWLLEQKEKEEKLKEE